jgi:excisionase family DNA binding protein
MKWMTKLFGVSKVPLPHSSAQNFHLVQVFLNSSLCLLHLSNFIVKMENPFELILERLDRIEKAIQNLDIQESKAPVKELQNLEQLASYLKVSKSAIYKLTSTKEIPHYKNGHKLYFKKSDIDEWIFSKKIKIQDDLKKEAMEYLLKNSKKS